MIEEISIENLGVIRSARVALSSGLTVITGETGAGKTMVLTGLGLLLGGKADPAVVRPGAPTATVEGRIRVPDNGAVDQRVVEAGGSADEDGTVVIVRTVAAEGRSRAHLGGRSVPQAVLGEIAEDLVTVHGQSDQLRLRTAVHQRAALDAFAGSEHELVLTEYRRAWARRAVVLGEIDELTTQGAERAAEAERLRTGLDQIERVDPQPGEDDELKVKLTRLGHVQELRQAAQVAHEALAGEETHVASALPAVERARRALETAALTDPGLGRLVERLADVGYAIADIATEVSGYDESLHADPAGIEQGNARLAELGALTRVYGPTLDDVVQWAGDAGLRLLDLEDSDGRVSALVQEQAQIETRLAELAGQVTAARAAAARELAALVTQELAGLAMSGARLDVTVEPAREPGPHGADTVTFGLVPHAGAGVRPLGKGASGGELSRVMLALEVVLSTEVADGAALPTFVFDEVDAGVGGRAATEVGRRLALLARGAQVVVVTHLAQVAAFADCHVVVTKTSSADHGADVTVTGVDEVVGEARVRELARMLSGHEDSDTARRHAEELLDSSVVGR